MFYLNRIEWTTTTYTFNCNQRERLEERRGERDEYLKHLELWQLLRIIRILISIWGVIHHPRVCRIREGTKLRWNERRKGKILRERGGGSGDLLLGGIGLIEAYSWEECVESTVEDQVKVSDEPIPRISWKKLDLSFFSFHSFNRFIQECHQPLYGSDHY